MLPDSLLDLICKGLAEDCITKEARTTLGLPGGFLAKEYSILAILLHQYQSNWQQHDSRLYYGMQHYVLTVGRGRMEVLRCHNNDPIARHFGAKRTIKLVSITTYWPGIARKVKAYTQAGSTHQRVRSVRHRSH